MNQVQSPKLSYAAFLDRKTQMGSESGFEPLFMPDCLFPFQRALTEWAVKKGRAALFENPGLGKTLQQLVWGQNMVEHTCKPGLILTPLAVGAQTVREGTKFGIECKQSRDGKVVAPITVTNYHNLHKFDWKDFAWCACDESGILKSFDSSFRCQIIEFMRHFKYRLLASATPAPNEYAELGNSSEALGEMRRVEMMAHFFNHDGGDTSQWRLKKHAAKHIFWQWICTWARAVRMPSDMGFTDEGFILPELKTVEHIIHATTKNEEYLFDMPAVGLDEQRKECRRTINERCEMAASLINGTGKPAIAWCHLNEEGHLLEKLIPDAVEVEGADSEEFKEETFEAFVLGQIRVLVSKSRIAGLGLNFQHCAHQTFFPSHSFEEMFQAVRRSWRFGQKNPVTIDIISSEGEAGVLANVNRKAVAADLMFAKLVELINSELRVEPQTKHTQEMKEIPWL